MARSTWRTALRWVLGLIGGVVLVLALIILIPMPHRAFTYRPLPAPSSYGDAVAQLRAIFAKTPATVRPEGHPILLEHGAPADRVFVLLHGLSNCPTQFASLGQILYDHGCNVVIPLMPYHGETDRMTTEWRKLTAQQMLDSANRAADLAHGLGRHVTVVGLSVNGAVTAWMAQNRSDVDSMIFSPFLDPAIVPDWATTPAMNLMLRLPNIFLWWDPRLKENNPGPPYAYPRFPTRVVGETMLLAREVAWQAKHHPPAGPAITVVTTGYDLAANNETTDRLIEQWKRWNPPSLVTYRFPADEHVIHDFIDPHQPHQQVARVYPVLLDLMLKARPQAAAR